jgi:3-methyl-2-oxobutanoate hydroxymethyltransferase
VSEVQDRAFPAPEHTFKPNGARSPRPKADEMLTTDEIPPHWQTH